MAFLAETILPANLSTLAEEATINGEKRKNWYMEGIFIQGDVRNYNERVYPTSEIRNAVNTIQKKIDDGFTVVGEADHPETLTINIDRISHVIENMRMEGSNGIGKLRILEDTHYGKEVAALLKNGVKLGVSSRGSGEVGYDGMVRNFEIVTVDIVVQPSAPSAYPKTLYESLYGNVHGREADKLAGYITEHNENSAEAYFEKEMKKFIESIGV